MADLDYTVAVNTAAAEKNLANLQRSVSGISDTFIRFKSTLATISLSALFQQALALSDTLQDLSDATEISTNRILGFSNAVAANGGTMDGAQKGLARLVAEIDGAANSAGASREAFKEVGVSLTDLRTKSSSQIFEQAIKGLAGIDDVAKRARLATELLGKEARNINFKNVSDDFNTASASALRYSGAIKSSADANDNIAKAIKTFQLEVIKVIQPITDFINRINVSTDSVSKFFDMVGNAIYWAAIIASFTYLGRAVVGLYMAFRAGILVITEFGTSIAGLWRILTNGELLAALITNLKLLPGVGSAATVTLEAMGTAAQFLVKHWQGITIAIGAAIGAFREWAGLGKDEEGPKGRSYSADDARRMQEYLDEQANKIKRGQEAMAKFKGEVAKANLESSQSLQIQGIGLSNLGFRLGLERSLIGLTEDQKEIEKQRFDLEIQRIDKQDEYARAIKKLQVEKSNTKDEEANRLLGARIGILQAEAKESDALYRRQKEGILSELKELQKVRMIEAARVQDQQNIIKGIEDQIARQQQLGDTLRSINDQKVDIKFQGSQQGMGPLEKQISDIQENARKAALEAGRAFAATFPEDLSAASAAELADGLDMIAKKYASISAEQIKNLETSRSWSTGWNAAFKSYAESARDSAAQAKTYFDTFSKGFEDLIVALVTNGKWSFKDFANSIIADFARIQAKKMLVNLMDMSGGGGIFSAIGSLFGMANGGSVQSNVPIMVGERGPELFIPKGAGSIVPNGAMNAAASSGQAMQTIVNYNIQAVDASSFRSLVARDPSFIYAVTEQGRRSQPTRRLG